VLNTLRKQGYKLNIGMRCESPEAVQIAVTQNLGIGFLYHDAVKATIERGSFKTIEIRGLDIEGRTYIVYQKERPLSPNAEEFLKLLRDWRDQH
jgi:DNA-binding transcriptional LysR family regulator